MRESQRTLPVLILSLLTISFTTTLYSGFHTTKAGEGDELQKSELQRTDEGLKHFNGEEFEELEKTDVVKTRTGPHHWNGEKLVGPLEESDHLKTDEGAKHFNGEELVDLEKTDLVDATTIDGEKTKKHWNGEHFTDPLEKSDRLKTPEGIKHFNGEELEELEKSDVVETPTGPQHWNGEKFVGPLEESDHLKTDEGDKHFNGEELEDLEKTDLVDATTIDGEKTKKHWNGENFSNPLQKSARLKTPEGLKHFNGEELQDLEKTDVVETPTGPHHWNGEQFVGPLKKSDVLKTDEGNKHFNGEELVDLEKTDLVDATTIGGEKTKKHWNGEKFSHPLQKSARLKTPEGLKHFNGEELEELEKSDVVETPTGLMHWNGEKLVGPLEESDRIETSEGIRHFNGETLEPPEKGEGNRRTVNKGELIDRIASETNLTKADAKKALDAFIDTTMDALRKGDRVALEGLGTFFVADRKGRNPQTGEEIQIPAKKVVRFQPDARLVRNIVRKGGPPQPSGRTMNKAELIDAIASEADISKADAKRALDAFIDNTTQALKRGDRVALVGFGSFSGSKRAARKGRNPQTGKEIKIPAKKIVKFKPGAELSEKIK